ncbi:MAG: hypothetical protein JJU36_10220 [Phycisphaeraceae bacterium]|nr:hypothetical protein [Phycisphaeraceae bacterium]
MNSPTIAGRIVALTAIVLLFGCLVACQTQASIVARSVSDPPPGIDVSADIIAIELGNGVALRFAVHDGWLLGLRDARFSDVELTSAQTVQRPLISQEFIQPGIWPFMKLVSARRVDGAVELEVELYGGSSRELFMEEFVFAPDFDAAIGEKITAELAMLRDRAAAARQRLDPLVADDDSLNRIRARLEQERNRTKDIDPEMTWDVINNRRNIERFERNLAEAKRRLYNDAVRTDEHRASLAAIEAFEKAHQQRAEEVSSIHRDFYAFAHLRLPSETCRVNSLIARINARRQTLERGGRLVWTVRPVTRQIAGWEWNGWSQSYQVQLDHGHQVNNLRQIGTWEIGGQAAGMTVVNLRYRGLGGIEQTLDAADRGPGVRSAWSTTEMIPGAAGGAPAVSPVVPPAADQTLEDRGYALTHRVGAWISKLGRGSGVGFVDFQHRDGLTLISSFDRQGAHRALTEIFPGDRELSQTDEQWFANTDRFETEHQLYLMLRQNPGKHEMTTRWQEVDQYFRDVVSENLGFVQVDPLPGVGWLVEAGRASFFQSLADDRFRQWHATGMRMHVTHTPGWYTEQHRNGPDRPQTPGGNSNRIFDWIITDDVKAHWRTTQQFSREEGIPFFIYLGGMVRPDGPFARQVGTGPEKWSMNIPGANYSHGYPPLVGHNLYVPETRKLLTQRLKDIQRNLGFQGLWCDSFQNMFMSQLNWGDGSGAPMQAKWWPLLAEWSRMGIHLMAESHAFPGLSCSIEVAEWEQAYHYFQYVWKWHRGGSQRNYTAEQHNEMTYRFMANKSWLAPDNATVAVIPDFSRFSAEYMAALPDMRRSWVLPGGAGVLWMPFDTNNRGIWFSYIESEVPSGVTAVYLLDSEGSNVGRTEARRTYRLSGEDLPSLLGMARPPHEDPRMKHRFEPVDFVFPEKRP